jgi:ABC-2 type transport system ATP-binding protein
MGKILEINNLAKHYTGFSLNNISFSLERGYIMGLIGPNGAGKSTTIKLIMNLIKKNDGDIKVFGLDHITHEQEIKERIGFVYDENHYFDELTILETKRFIAPFYKKWDNETFMRNITSFKLPTNKKIKELSKGMKMKFSLSIALSHQAELLIMDEPTSGLDPLVRNELLDILMTLMQDEDKAVLFSTHITSDLDKIADYITFINHGDVILSLPKDDLLDQYGVVKGDKQQLKTIQKYIIGSKENQFGFEALVNNKQKVREICDDRVIIEKPDLEDIMLFYTRGGII